MSPIQRFPIFTTCWMVLAGIALAQAPDNGQTPSETADVENANTLGKPEEAIPFTDVPDSFISLGKPRMGRRRIPTKISERAPKGGFLVGLELTHKQGFGRRTECRSVRAIYQVNDTYHYGKLFGVEGPQRTRLLAGRGQAVGGCQFDFFGGRIKAARLIYYPFDGKQMIAKGRTMSEAFGNNIGSFDLDVDVAQPAIGIAINIQDDREAFAPEEDEDDFFPEEDMDDLVRINGLTLAFADVASATLVGTESKPLPVLPTPPHLREHELLLSNGNSGTVRYYESSAPDGACLVGFRAYDSKTGRTHGARLTPIYQLDKKVVLGPDPQDTSEKVQTVRAKPGFAVCGCLFQGNSLRRVAFAAMQSNGKLNMKDTYLSDDRPVGRGEKSSWKTKAAEPIRGLKYSYTVGIDAIAFVTGSMAEPPKRSPPKLTQAGEPFGASPFKRVWTSDRGKQVEAWLVRFSQQRVWIQRDGGEAFRLPLEKYSPADQAYLQSLDRMPRRDSPRKSR